VESELGDVRPEQCSLNRDHGPCTQTEDIAGSGGVKQRGQVLRFGPEALEVPI
jgi:hypothetical protein